MTVYIVDKAPQRLRGILSRFCLEIRAGVFVGKTDKRLREKLWEKIEQHASVKTGAVMVWQSSNEQGYSFQAFGDNKRMPLFVDGLWLVEYNTEV